MKINKIEADLSLQKLAVELGLPEGVDVLDALLNAREDAWETLTGFCRYEQHRYSRQVRNKGTRRVLRPNPKGFLKLKADDGVYRYFNTRIRRDFA
ncbi:hypothetical protein [Agarivorans sp. 1_MG-2023]|uniref:hypothetical protein n=1 Tax=Agarivorans sp. 1_MG-2023 TaxID=3062634 RepID=UPI0026E23B04|nr:hypothetical protein [Agarivorans sp. 1_MG-2023]MDO6763410.1 hypothetical protein [Agarivorans sp. 1_MG-2023]